MPTPRGAAGAAVAGGKMYVIGGYGSGGSQTANEV
jgi:Kelch motif